jgi:hypothetical protein
MSALREIDDAYLQCRTLGHSWDQIPDDGGGGHRSFTESRSVRRLCFRCTRCTLLRYEAWSAITGDLLFRTYQYPEDYHLPRDESNRHLMRVEWVQRLGTYQRGPTRSKVTRRGLT